MTFKNNGDAVNIGHEASGPVAALVHDSILKAHCVHLAEEGRTMDNLSFEVAAAVI